MILIFPFKEIPSSKTGKGWHTLRKITINKKLQVAVKPTALL